MTEDQAKQPRRWGLWRLLGIGLFVVMLGAPSLVYFWPRDPDTVPSRSDGARWQMDFEPIVSDKIAKYFPEDFWVRATRILYYRPGRLQPVRTYDGSNYVTYAGRSLTVYPSIASHLSKDALVPENSTDKITQEEIDWISEHSSLRALHLPNTNLTGLDLTPLRRLRQLRFLELDMTGLTPDDLIWIGNLKRLTGLYLRGVDVADTDLDFLANLNNLEDVLFDGVGLTDQKLAFLANQNNLRIAKFPYTGVTGSCLDGLKHPEKITRITLTGCRITPEFMAKIDRYTSLHIFWVSFTDFNDDDLKHVAELPGINALNIGNTQVTGEGLTALHQTQALTKLRINLEFKTRFDEELDTLTKASGNRVRVYTN